MCFGRSHAIFFIQRKTRDHSGFGECAMLTALSMLIALLLDWCVGWPDAVFRKIGHPVTWFGSIIATAENRFNHPRSSQRLVGAEVTVSIIFFAIAVAMIVGHFLPDSVVGAIVAGILAWPLVAARSMHDHFISVYGPLFDGHLASARREVAKIVGRDPETLDEAGVARAAIESLAENTSDGIIAPLFWGVVFGLPGIVGYKAINTLDSMIGHRNERYKEFGWAAARIDDVANLIPARLTAILFACAARSKAALQVMWKDARFHRSPNAGWPEASMAGALGVRLSGPRGYGETWSDEPWLNSAAPDPIPADLNLAREYYLRTMLLVGVALCLLAL